MRKAAVYPVTPNNSYLVDELSLHHRELMITTIVVPNAYSNRVNLSGYQTCHSISEIDDCVEIVVFLSFWDEQRILTDMEMILKRGINVLTATRLKTEQIAWLELIAREHGASFCAFGMDIMQYLEDRDDPFLQPEGVVIAVGTVTQGIHTAKHVVQLGDELKRKEYTICTICCNPDLQLLDGFFYLPIEQMLSSNLDKAIVEINHFINYVQAIRKPDVIIIQLPEEGMYRMSNDFCTCFGVQTYCISQAVEFDYGIAVSPLLGIDAGLYTLLSEISQYRFGFQYDSVIIVPKIVNVDVPPGVENMKYYMGSNEQTDSTVAKLKEQSNTILFHSDIQNCTISIVEDIIDHLS